ncbi:hypothetical protein CF319_g8658 [Tilletia indica]|nr:hypothetical protein CF319_g8658 [Tilletia indica]
MNTQRMAAKAPRAKAKPMFKIFPNLTFYNESHGVLSARYPCAKPPQIMVEFGALKVPMGGRTSYKYKKDPSYCVASLVGVSHDATPIGDAWRATTSTRACASLSICKRACVIVNDTEVRFTVASVVALAGAISAATDGPYGLGQAPSGFIKGVLNTTLNCNISALGILPLIAHQMLFRVSTVLPDKTF